MYIMTTINVQKVTISRRKTEEKEPEVNPYVRIANDSAKD